MHKLSLKKKLRTKDSSQIHTICIQKDDDFGHRIWPKRLHLLLQNVIQCLMSWIITFC